MIYSLPSTRSVGDEQSLVAENWRDSKKIDGLEVVGGCFCFRSNLRTVRIRKKASYTRSLVLYCSLFGSVLEHSYSCARWKLFFDVHSIYFEAYLVLKNIVANEKTKMCDYLFLFLFSQVDPKVLTINAISFIANYLHIMVGKLVK